MPQGALYVWANALMWTDDSHKVAFDLHEKTSHCVPKIQKPPPAGSQAFW